MGNITGNLYLRFIGTAAQGALCSISISAFAWMTAFATERIADALPLKNNTFERLLSFLLAGGAVLEGTVGFAAIMGYHMYRLIRHLFAERDNHE